MALNKEKLRAPSTQRTNLRLRLYVSTTLYYMYDVIRAISHHHSSICSVTVLWQKHLKCTNKFRRPIFIKIDRMPGAGVDQIWEKLRHFYIPFLRGNELI